MSENLQTEAVLAKLDLSEEDIYEAMKQIPGYLDITPHNFREVYHLALRLAVERLSREVLARDLMTREVVWVSPETPLAEVAAAMGRARVSGVPVVDDRGQVVGVVSEKDFLKRMGSNAPNFMTLVADCLKSRGCVALPLKEQRAADLMSAPAVTVKPHTPVREIVALMAAHNINRLPVTDAGGRLVGIVSRGDLVWTAGLRGRPA